MSKIVEKQLNVIISSGYRDLFDTESTKVFAKSLGCNRLANYIEYHKKEYCEKILSGTITNL